MRISRLRRARVGVLATALVPAFALVGCASTLNTSKLEDNIKKDIQSQGGKANSVSCPSDVTAKAGNTFTCKVTFTTAQGVKHMGTITVDQLDSNGNVRLTNFKVTS